MANRRHNLHKNQSSSRPLSKNYELIGLVGEWEFSKKFGVELDTKEYIDGDKGVDFVINGYKIDVKTGHNNAYNLLREKNKPHAEIIVLAECDLKSKSVYLIGWEYDSEMIKQPYKDFGYGIINHYKHRSELRSINELRELLNTDIEVKNENF